MCSPGWPHRGVEEDGSVCCREAGAPKQTMCRDIVHAEMNSLEEGGALRGSASLLPGIDRPSFKEGREGKPRMPPQNPPTSQKCTKYVTLEVLPKVVLKMFALEVLPKCFPASVDVAVHPPHSLGNMGDLEACQQLLKADSSMVLKEEGINRGFRNFAVRVGTRTPSKQMGRKLSERDKDSVVHQMYRGPAGHVLRPSATWEPLARSSKG
eukprot:scaffold98597_cov22-Tisochrysis_lutea.AAC.2